MGAVFSVVLDVTLSMEEIVEEEICHTRKGEKRKTENEMANQGGFNSGKKLLAVKRELEPRFPSLTLNLMIWTQN